MLRNIYDDEFQNMYNNEKNNESLIESESAGTSDPYFADSSG